MTIAILVFFGIAEPDTYRTKLWQDGFNNGFNSSPAQPLYDMVNGKASKLISPLVWSALSVSKLIEYNPPQLTS
jgi:hypothetical protein